MEGRRGGRAGGAAGVQGRAKSVACLNAFPSGLSAPERSLSKVRLGAWQLF